MTITTEHSEAMVRASERRRYLGQLLALCDRKTTETRSIVWASRAHWIQRLLEEEGKLHVAIEIEAMIRDGKAMDEISHLLEVDEQSVLEVAFRVGKELHSEWAFLDFIREFMRYRNVIDGPWYKDQS